MARWRKIRTAPDAFGKPLLLAAPGLTIGAWIVGEGYLNENDGCWWWANEGPGDYHAQSLESAGTPPTHWMPMPEPPNA